MILKMFWIFPFDIFVFCVAPDCMYSTFIVIFIYREATFPSNPTRSRSGRRLYCPTVLRSTGAATPRHHLVPWWYSHCPRGQNPGQYIPSSLTNATFFNFLIIQPTYIHMKKFPSALLYYYFEYEPVFFWMCVCYLCEVHKYMHNGEIWNLMKIWNFLKYSLVFYV